MLENRSILERASEKMIRNLSHSSKCDHTSRNFQALFSKGFIVALNSHLVLVKRILFHFSGKLHLPSPEPLIGKDFEH